MGIRVRFRWASTALLLCAATGIAARAQTLTTLASFGSIDGYPTAAPVQGTDGNFYGTAEGGVSQTCTQLNTPGCGSIYKVTPDGTLTTLYTFCSQPNCADGSGPFAGLLQATNGKFYGTTQFAGDLSCGPTTPRDGCGTVFEFTPEGVLTTLHTFAGPDGSWPFGTLIQATDGDLYGTTFEGGSYTNPICGGSNVGCGTVFKMTPGGALTTFFSFCSTSSCPAYEPQAALLQATNGNFYTTTTLGSGDVVKLTPESQFKVLRGFNGHDGLHPMASLIQATDGNFYGMTPEGGVISELGYGTVFKITPAGDLTVLHIFHFTADDGAAPWGALVQATDGNLYGATTSGGLYDAGTIFTITTEGKITILHNFSGPDGSKPEASLIQGTDGNLYGTTWSGGANGTGTVFSLNVGLGPFVIASPGSGKAGAKISILGTNLTGVTGVTFNGTPARFTVPSPSVIDAIVPAGATTGRVQVTTAGGTLSSNAAFLVRK